MFLGGKIYTYSSFYLKNVKIDDIINMVMVITDSQLIKRYTGACIPEHETLAVTGISNPTLMRSSVTVNGAAS